MQPCQDIAELVALVLGHNPRHWLPDHLLSSKAIHPLRRAIPARDHTFERFANDRVVGVGNDRRQSFGRLLRAPRFRSIAEYQDHANDLSIRMTNGRRTIVNRSLKTIPSDEHRVISKSHDLPALQHALA